MEENKKVTRESVVYDVENMTVVRWGSTWAYWRYDVKDVPDEIKLYALKGFIDDLQDCTVSIKKSDYKDTEIGRDAYRLDCLAKRRELERQINEGTRSRANTSETTVAKKTINSLKEASKAVTLQGLIIKQAMAAIPGNPSFTEEDAKKLAEFMAIAARGVEKN
jgi:hypothetical protein